MHGVGASPCYEEIAKKIIIHMELFIFKIGTL